MKLTNTHRLILEMLLHHPEGIRREDINEVLKREGERVLDDRRRLYKYLDSFRKSLGLNIATVHLGATDFKYRLCDTKGMPTGFAEQMVTNILENDFLQTFKDLGSRIQAVRIPRGSNFLKTIGLAMRNKRLLRVTYQKFDDVAPYDCILAPHALKAFEGRWYLFAVKWMSEDDVKQQPLGCKGIGLQTFALDRMLYQMEHGWLKESKERIKLFESVPKGLGAERILAVFERETRETEGVLTEREKVHFC